MEGMQIQNFNEQGNGTRMKQPQNFTFEESDDCTEQLINVTVGVTYWQEVQVDVLENATIYQRLQVRHQVTVLVFPVTKAMTRAHVLNLCDWKHTQSKGTYLHVLSSWRNQVLGNFPFLSM